MTAAADARLRVRSAVDDTPVATAACVAAVVFCPVCVAAVVLDDEVVVDLIVNRMALISQTMTHCVTKGMLASEIATMFLVWGAGLAWAMAI